MNTVFGDWGTILHHVALSTAVQWTGARLGSSCPIGYIDTHAMSPLNKPVEFEEIDRLLDQTACCSGTHPYRRVLQIATRLRGRGLGDYYPNHFLVASLGAQALRIPLIAHLFENDGAGSGRRTAIEAILGDSAMLESVGLSQASMFASLAPGSGSFRDEDGWKAMGACQCRGVIVNSDPSLLALASGENFAMTPSDFSFLGKMLGDHPTPEFIVHVSFAMAPQKSEASQPSALRPVSEDPILTAWREAFPPAGFEAPANGSAILEWSNFRMLLGVCVPRGAELGDGIRPMVRQIAEELHHLACMRSGRCGMSPRFVPLETESPCPFRVLTA